MSFKKYSQKYLLLATSLCAALQITPVAAQDISLSTGIDYSSGTYGSTQSTNITYIPLTLKYEDSLWSLKLTTPYIRVTNPISNPALQTAQGLGDMVMTGTRNIYQNSSNGIAIDLTGKIKVPTADSSQGLGTGKYDYSAQIDLSKQSSTYITFGSLGYRKMGDPDGINFNNPWFGSIGIGHNLSNTTQWGGIYEAQQNTLDENSAIKDFLTYITHRISATQSIQIYIAKGLSDSSPDWASGLSMTTRF